jgi:enoyl-CoA hydratase
MAEKQAVRWEKQGRVATVWLCNPQKRNAMGPAFWEELPEAMGEIAADAELAAEVICAEGPAFSVGLDLKTMMGTLAPSPSQIETRERLLKTIYRLQASVNSVAECTLPVIAAIHGYCIGGAVDLISACDIRLGAKDMSVSVRETKVGMVADLGTLQRLPRLIGHGHVAELAFTGKDINAERALRIGLVNDLYETGEDTIRAAHELAKEICENSPLVVRGVKRVLNYSKEHSVEEGLEYVAMHNTAFLLSDDLGEAMAAFMQKRRPVFKGR